MKQVSPEIAARNVKVLRLKRRLLIFLALFFCVFEELAAIAPAYN